MVELAVVADVIVVDAYAVVSLPVESMEVVPVCPTAKVLAEKAVEVAPPKKRSNVDVEFPAWPLKVSEVNGNELVIWRRVA